MVVRNSPTLHFYETHALLNQKCGWSGGVTLVCGSKTIGTKRMYTNEWECIEMPFDLINQISCNHISYKAPCKCVLDIIIIINTQAYVCSCNCMHMDTCGTSRWARYILHWTYVLTLYMHTHCLPSQAINKHLWKLNSCTRHEQWKLNIFMFRSWHSTYFKDTNDALYMPAYGGIPYSH